RLERWRAPNRSFFPIRESAISWSHLDASGAQFTPQAWNGNLTQVKYARRQRRIDARRPEDLHEVLRRAGAPGGHQGHLTAFARSTQLRNIIPAAHAVARHAIEHNLSGAAL